MSTNAPADSRDIITKALFEIRELKARLASQEREGSGAPLAIVGAACRLPGHANTLGEFWELLRGGVDAITEIPAERWDVEEFYDQDPTALGKMYIRHGGFIDGADRFDASFFGITPREAVQMDPQHRLLLEVAWEALENAGIPADRLKNSRTGVYVGIGSEDYGSLTCRDFDKLTPYHISTDMAIASGRLAFAFGLQGPVMSVDTMCSSGLVALHLAIQAVRAGECELALVGGVNLIANPAVSVILARAAAASPTGRCKTFDASADGYVRSEGCIVLAVKRLADAQRDNDPIMAVIRGTAINHDGPASGLTVPNGLAQRAVIRQALKNGSIQPADVSYIEAHGTGTSLGDPIEVSAFGDVLGAERPKNSPLMIGSVKSNIGHLESAAGLSGLLKVVLSLQNKAIPPHLHLKKLNPNIELDSIPARIVTELTPWETKGRPRIGGVSSFGMSGTNAHVILEEAPAASAKAAEPIGEPSVHLIPLSARGADALWQHADDWRTMLTQGKPVEIESLAHSAAQRRCHHDVRLAIAAKSTSELVDGLSAFLRNESHPALSVGERTPGHRFKTVFVFSGQGAQWPGMAMELYEREPAFRTKLEACDRAFSSVAKFSILDELKKASRLDETEVAQPAIVCMQLALVALWESYGVRPDAVIGHSIGEVTAAAVAGILTLEDAMLVIYHRSRLMQRTTGGGKMAAIDLSAAEAEEVIANYPQLSIASVNAPKSVVLAGDAAKLEEVLGGLQGRGVGVRKMGVNYAFHSPQMEPIQTELAQALAGLKLREATCEIYSTVSGTLAVANDFGPDYWARNIRQPVRFADALSQALVNGYNTVVEIAPHPVLNTSISQVVEATKPEAKAYFCVRRNQPELSTFLRAVGDLYCGGFALDWKRSASKGSFVRLPLYPWQHERFWSDEASTNRSRIAAPSARQITRLDVPWPVFQSNWTDGRCPWLVDYRVRGARILPFAAVLATLLDSGLDVDGAGAVTELKFDDPSWLSHGEANLQVSFRPTGSEERQKNYAVELFCKVDERWSPIAHASLKPATPVERKLVRVEGRQERFAGSTFYANLARHGLDVGPRMQCIEDYTQCLDEYTTKVIGIEARVRLPQDAMGDQSASRIHPIVLETALQLLNVVSGDPQRNLQPVSCNIVQIGAGRGAPDVVQANLRDMTATGVLGDVRIFNASGELLLQIEGLRLEEVAEHWQNQVSLARLATALYLPVWKQKKTTGGPIGSGKTWLVFVDGGGFGERLAEVIREKGDACTLVRASDHYGKAEDGSIRLRAGERGDFTKCLQETKADSVVHLWGLDLASADPLDDSGQERLALESTLHLIQSAAATAEKPPRVWVVTRGAQEVHSARDDVTDINLHASMLWGMGRSIAIEHPELWGGLIDLDPRDGCESTQAGMLFAEMNAAFAGDKKEDQVAYRGMKRFVLRVNETSSPMPKSAFAAPADGTVLITGGLGSLGLELARHLAKAGTKRLALMGRQSPSPDARRVIAELEALGTHVISVQCDVADRQSLARALRDLERDGELSGVIHAAGVLADAPLSRLTWSHFESVLRAKVQGAIHLHELTKDMSLHYFVLFSSMSSFLGAAGQANYAAANSFLDSLAYRRRSLGLPALCVSWGPWADTGMAARLGLSASAQVDRGLLPIPIEAGMNLLGRMIESGETVAAVLPLDWSRFLKLFPAGPPAMLADLAPGEAANDGPSLTDMLLETPPAKRRQAVLRYVEETVRHVLMLPSSKQIHPDQGLSAIGMDSLMALTLRNVLQTGTGRSLSATLAFDRPNITSLTDYLLNDVLRLAVSDEPQEVVSLHGEQDARAIRLKNFEEEASALSEDESEAELLKALEVTSRKKVTR